MIKKKFLATAFLAGLFGVMNLSPVQAQQNSNSNSSSSDEIIIRKKGDKNEKLTIEFKDGQMIINGKAVSDYNDDDISVSRRRAVNDRAVIGRASPFRGGTMNFNSLSTTSSNKALMGIYTQGTDNKKGVVITNVSRKSAAEKAGLKEGDIVTRIDDTPINSPEDLTKAVGKYKPEDKVTVTYKRDQKEQKASVTLDKRAVATTFSTGGEPFNSSSFSFDMGTTDTNGIFNLVRRNNGPRLGLQAQDTEDGKGVKVLKVEDSSNAAKAGIRADDIITEFNGRDIRSTTDLLEAAKDMNSKSSVRTKLTRNGKTQEMDIKIPKRLKTTTL